MHVVVITQLGYVMISASKESIQTNGQLVTSQNPDMRIDHSMYVLSSGDPPMMP